MPSRLLEKNDATRINTEHNKKVIDLRKKIDIVKNYLNPRIDTGKLFIKDPIQRLATLEKEKRRLQNNTQKKREANTHNKSQKIRESNTHNKSQINKIDAGTVEMVNIQPQPSEKEALLNEEARKRLFAKIDAEKARKIEAAEKEQKQKSRYAAAAEKEQKKKARYAAAAENVRNVLANLNTISNSYNNTNYFDKYDVMQSQVQVDTGNTSIFENIIANVKNSEIKNLLNESFEKLNYSRQVPHTIFTHHNSLKDELNEAIDDFTKPNDFDTFITKILGLLNDPSPYKEGEKVETVENINIIKNEYLIETGKYNIVDDIVKTLDKIKGIIDNIEKVKTSQKYSEDALFTAENAPDTHTVYKPIIKKIEDITQDEFARLDVITEVYKELRNVFRQIQPTTNEIFLTRVGRAAKATGRAAKATSKAAIFAARKTRETAYDATQATGSAAATVVQNTRDTAHATGNVATDAKKAATDPIFAAAAKEIEEEEEKAIQISDTIDELSNSYNNNKNVKHYFVTDNEYDTMTSQARVDNTDNKTKITKITSTIATVQLSKIRELLNNSFHNLNYSRQVPHDIFKQHMSLKLALVETRNYLPANSHQVFKNFINHTLKLLNNPPQFDENVPVENVPNIETIRNQYLIETGKYDIVDNIVGILVKINGIILNIKKINMSPKYSDDALFDTSAPVIQTAYKPVVEKIENITREEFARFGAITKVYIALRNVFQRIKPTTSERIKTRGKHLVNKTRRAVTSAAKSTNRTRKNISSATGSAAKATGKATIIAAQKTRDTVLTAASAAAEATGRAATATGSAASAAAATAIQTGKNAAHFFYDLSGSVQDFATGTNANIQTVYKSASSVASSTLGQMSTGLTTFFADSKAIEPLIIDQKIVQHNKKIEDMCKSVDPDKILLAVYHTVDNKYMCLFQNKDGDIVEAEGNVKGNDSNNQRIEV